MPGAHWYNGRLYSVRGGRSTSKLELLDHPGYSVPVFMYPEGTGPGAAGPTGGMMAVATML